MPPVSQRETFTCSALLVTRPCCSLKACSWGHVWEWLFLTKHHWIWRWPGERVRAWGCGLAPALSVPPYLGRHLLPDVLSALGGAAVGLGDVAHGEGHEAQRVVAVDIRAQLRGGDEERPLLPQTPLLLTTSLVHGPF